MVRRDHVIPHPIPTHLTSPHLTSPHFGVSDQHWVQNGIWRNLTGEIVVTTGRRGMGGAPSKGFQYAVRSRMGDVPAAVYSRVKGWSWL